MKRKLRRGDVYLINFPKPDHPKEFIQKFSLVLQEGKIVDSSSTVVVVNLTTQRLDRIYATDVLLSPEESHTEKGAKVICNQIHTISKKFIVEYKYSLTKGTMDIIDERLALGIGFVKLEDLKDT